MFRAAKDRNDLFRPTRRAEFLCGFSDVPKMYLTSVTPLHRFHLRITFRFRRSMNFPSHTLYNLAKVLDREV